jgi:hypothetical protein
MSIATKSCTPERAATAHAPIAPPAGPEPSDATARRARNSAVMMPPLLCMIRSSAR